MGLDIGKLWTLFCKLVDFIQSLDVRDQQWILDNPREFLLRVADCMKRP